jgi:hypothetical protein
MEFKQSLAQRIIIAFALMSALVAGAFAMGIVATVHLVEEKLISAGLGGDLQRLLLMDSVEDWSHRPEPDQLFYFSGGPRRFRTAQGLRHLEPGFHEVFRDALSYHAMVESRRRASLRPAARPERFRRARARAVCRGAGRALCSAWRWPCSSAGCWPVR